MKNLILKILILASMMSCTAEPVATCFDSLQNGTEMGIDCGGDCAPCISCDDGIQNGTEEGIDCGLSCGVQCPIIIDCEGESLCMKAIVQGFYLSLIHI